MFKNHRTTLIASASAICMTVAATSAMAQANSVGIEELVVTARKTEERAQDVPVAITAISPTRMKDMSIANLSDVSRSTPNLFVTRYNSNPASPLITIRGQAQQDVILSIDSPIGVYVDGVYLPHSFGLDQAMVDIERIEVLKGPQGTLYGKNTTGGAISIVTKNPDLTQVGGFVDATAGNYGAVGLTGVLNMPIIQDKLGVRLVAAHSKHDGYGRNAVGEELNDDNSQFYRAKIRWEAAENVHVLIAADYQRLYNNGSATHLKVVNDSPSLVPKTPANASAFSQVRAELGLPNTAAGLKAARDAMASYIYGAANGPKSFYDSAATEPQEGHFDGYGVSADVSVDLTDSITARSITSYRQFRRRDLNEIDASPFQILYADNQGFSKVLAEEIQVMGRTERLNWIVGGYANIEHAREQNAGLGSVTTPAINPNSPGRTLSQLRQTSWAVFGQAGYQITEQLRATAGLRWTEETKDNIAQNVAGPNRNCTVAVSLRPNPAICAAPFNSKFSDLSYLFSLDYKPADNILVYAKTSRGFKGGGQNIRGTTLETFTPFEPEVVTDYELGVKSDFLDRRLRVNGAIFYSDYKDIQRTARILSSTGTVISLLTNAASAKIKGAELEITARPISALTLNASAGITKTNYGTFNDAALGDRSGEPFAIPKTTWSVSGVYVVPLENGELRFAADYNWRAKVAFAPAAIFVNQVTQESYGLANARVAYNMDADGLEVALFVKNLTAKKYYAASGSFDNSLGYNINYVGTPRTYGIQLVKKFGGG